MEKNRKLELLAGIMDEFNLSVEDLVAYRKANGKFETNKRARQTGKMAQVLSTENYQMPEEILPGMYVYADGLICPEIIEGRQIKAVIGYVEGNTAYAVCLQETMLPWSSDWLEVRVTQKLTSGKEATRKIIEAAQKKNRKAEAAQWCYDYAQDGVKQGEAFLPSLTELEKLFANKAVINVSLKKLGVPLLDDKYWPSTEYSYNYAWFVVLSSGSRTYSTKDYSRYVRPVLTLKL